MPVTFCPATHVAKSSVAKPVTSSQILQQACPNQFEQVDQIMQFSIGGRSGASDTLFKIVPNENGFVNTVLTAYNHHHALIIRPDDVWLAIISQFSFYVNANAELLRANFVAHEGKKELEIYGDWPPDFGLLSRQMGGLIHQNVVDPGLREWILPKFSTTTTNDTTIGSILMMAAMKHYFSYKMSFLCGIPRVTLEGERHDWELLLHRLEKLKEYGLETIAWYHLLVPVVSRFVKAFDAPTSPENFEFWQKVARSEPYGSGSDYCSGWITAFCVFSAEGRWQGPKLDTKRNQSSPPESLSSRDFWSAYIGLRPRGLPLTLDDTEYPRIDSDDIPAGYAEVDVTINDNGTEFPSVIVAGLVGMGFSSSRDLSVSKTGKNDTLRPVLAWWMYSKLDEEEKKRRQELASHDAYTPPISPPQPIIIIPTPPSSSGSGTRTDERRERRQSTPVTASQPVVVPPLTESTKHWVTDQACANQQQGSSGGHARRNSESAVPASKPANVELPARKKQNSLLKRIFKS